MGLIEPLDWDSSFFGLSIARVRSGVDATTIGSAVEEADARRIGCLYLLAAADGEALIDCAQGHGFVVRDIRVELEREVLGDTEEKPEVRCATAADVAQLAPIAREGVRGTRFFADPGFRPALSSEMYVAWLRLGLLGAPERVTLMPMDASGFVVCHLDTGAGTGTIELIAVAGDARGRGVGGTLLAGAERLFAKASLKRATVVTQGRNIPAQRLYQKHGYRTSSVGLWLHRWRPATSPP